MNHIQSIQYRIHEIRGLRVMLDFDLAQLYETETKRLNEQVKRNIKRFPEDFMFRLTTTEWQSMRSQLVTASSESPMRSQFATASNELSLPSQVVTASQSKRNTIITPYAFTEQGIAMLSGVLNSDKAINMNIAIMRAFVELRRVLLSHIDIRAQFETIREHLTNHDVQLNGIYDSIENLLDEKVEKRK